MWWITPPANPPYELGHRAHRLVRLVARWAAIMKRKVVLYFASGRYRELLGGES